MSYFCTDYSIDEDYTIGERTVYIPSNETYDNILFFGYEECCWINLVESGNSKAIFMLTEADLTIRSDTGRINTSPISAMQPVVRGKQGFDDEDGDMVKCRWANDDIVNECGGETCILSYNATGSTGWYAVALQIEDFAFQIGTYPLSSVSLQFLIFVYSSTEMCDNKPSIDTSTDQDGAVIFILPNTTYYKTIIASTTSNHSKISAINTVSPIGMIKSSLLKYGSFEDKWYVNVTWTPKETDIGNQSNFCHMVVDSFNTKWNLARIDTNVSALCSGDYTGTVSRYCNTKGRWEEVDYSKCTHIAIKNIQEQDSSSITGLVKAVADYSKSFTNVLNSEFSLTIQKENIGLPITGYSSAFYRNISKLLPESLKSNTSYKYDVNSIIADFSIEPTPTKMNYHVVIKFQHISVVCTAIAVALHYLFLLDFALMLAEGIQVAIMVVIIFRTKSILQWLLPLCYIIPAVIVSISAGVTKLQGYGNSQLAGIKSICVIFPLFGITWILGAFSVNEDLVVFQYLFAVCNSLQDFQTRRTRDSTKYTTENRRRSDEDEILKGRNHHACHNTFYTQSKFYNPTFAH
ncbi:unnamed protein product [Mytilus coruscus]|uniref:G-protein coupled receptors family 2 profile 1 domain-containing protein n=1 Tax=Mytilus coruscus TaxID=42192 RepID=A0A6J8B7F0_MYTCO|nr:unnamed protein product [Mytilus coruscus]